MRSAFLVEGAEASAPPTPPPPPPLPPPPLAAAAVPPGPCLVQGPKKVVEMSPRIHLGTGCGRGGGGGGGGGAAVVVVCCFCGGGGGGAGAATPPLEEEGAGGAGFSASMTSAFPVFFSSFLAREALPPPLLSLFLAALEGSVFEFWERGGRER